jgi:heterodisulfide reductase subunit A
MDCRIGVFICHCGTNIGGIVDVPKVVEWVKKLDGVVYAERNLYTCSEDGLRSIKSGIEKHNLNRVVVASCTPRTHAPLFRRTCKEAGLNPYLFEFVNIREQCSWVHSSEPAHATQKAKELIKMSVARARLLEPLEEMQISVEPSALVVGGGVAGLNVSLSLANQGFVVYLVEREPKLGGMVAKLNRVAPTMVKSSEIISPLIESVKENENIRCYTSSEIKNIEGYIGNFNVKIESDGSEHDFKVGTIIIATGADELKPVGFYGYGKYKNVITQLELEQLLSNDFHAKNVVMIQCAGSRGLLVSYCSKRCCFTAIKNALLIKEIVPDAIINILHNEIRVYGVEYEKLYRKAQEAGIKFTKYPQDTRPVVYEDGGLTVEFFDEVLGMERKFMADLVVLSAPLVQREGAEHLSKMLKVPLGADKFFFEAHVKLRPVEFATDGIYVCGTARGPTNVAESVSQALGAASRASIPLAKGFVISEGIVSNVDESRCRGCGRCEENCDFKAIELVKSGERLVARTNEVLCKGCGKCAVICCNRSISARHFKTEQINAMIDAMLA